MIELIAVLRMAANISSAVAWSEFWMISSVMGSLLAVILPSSRAERDVDVAVAVDAHPVAGMDDDGGAGVLDDGRAGELHAGLELRAVVDPRPVHAFQRIVDVALALERGLGRRAG